MAQLGERALGRTVLDTSGVALVGSRCPRCGDTRFPARKFCPQDQTECREVTFSGSGTIYEAVQIFLAPPGFEAPFWVGYVDLDDGVRLFAQIRWDDDSSEPTHGHRVRMYVDTLGERDEPVIGPVFRKGQ